MKKKKESKDERYIRKRMKDLREMKEEERAAKPKPIGQIGIVALKNRFDRMAVAVLSEYIELSDDRKRGSPRKYNILKALPSKEEYDVMRDKKYTRTIRSLIEEAFDDAEDLKNELEEWFENLPQGFQDGDKGDAINSAKDQIEYAERPELPEDNDLEFVELVTLLKAEVIFLPLEASSRSDRLGECNRMLEVAIENLPKSNAATDEIKTALESAISEWENVDFPGMY